MTLDTVFDNIVLQEQPELFKDSIGLCNGLFKLFKDFNFIVVVCISLELFFQLLLL